MIEIDGIRIRRVVDIEFDSETGFRPIIYFHNDNRLDDCTDFDKLEKYEPQIWQEPSLEQVGIARIVLNGDTNIEFTTGE